jgi:hypothetical protein
MLASHTRSVLLAGLLTAALCAPAWSGDGDASKPETTGADLPLALATSPPVEPGPVVDRESLTKDVNAQAVVEGENEPTRTHGNLSVGKRYAGKRGRTAGGPSVAYAKPVHRYSLMLGIGF